MLMKSLFIDCNDQLAPVWQQVVRAGDPPIDVNRATFAPAELPRLLNGYDICIDDHSYLPTALVERCDGLKHVVFLGTGAASYMNIGELAQRGIRVHTIKGYGDTAVAEHAIALMMACCRDIARMDREVRSGTWSTREGVQLSGKTLGVIGLGGIGCEVLRIGRGLGMQVVAWNRTQRPGEALVELDELLTASDVISLHLAFNDDTSGFLGPAQLARMKPGVVLINTARGALVDETALIEALRSGSRKSLPRRGSRAEAGFRKRSCCNGTSSASRCAARAGFCRRFAKHVGLGVIDLPMRHHGQRHHHSPCRLSHARSLDDAAAIMP
jgi:D-3-phosphoglycerate dehydrogenase / 2-oxoglutarate reductase